ncbi:ACP S-malonyltransferase [Paenibacillus vandeheii]
MIDTRKTACLFGGQGLQYIGMGKEFYEFDEDCRQIFKTAEDVMGYDMAELCFYGQEESFEKEINSLPSMLTIDLCAFTVALKKGFSFQAVAGFSLGEYASLVAAKVVTVKEAFELVKIIAMISESELTDGSYGMAAVFTTAEMCENICASIQNGYVKIANYNSIKQVTIAGNMNGLESFRQIAAGLRIKVIPIKVNRPFHSGLMESAAKIFHNEIRATRFAAPVIPIYMNVTGEAETNAEEIKANLIKSLYSPVLWTETLRNLHLAGFEYYVECGLNNVLCRMVRDTLGIDKKNTLFIRAT